ncbi:hypothetical protein [Enterobacter cloacae]|uniref:hypothetical protein n=1 Tax=Enterobacter cloacae TaxID=550 RepID=UPI0013C379AD|nr:hypothetical protein [Enterobacter cloacae]
MDETKSNSAQQNKYASRKKTTFGEVALKVPHGMKDLSKANRTGNIELILESCFQR